MRDLTSDDVEKEVFDYLVTDILNYLKTQMNFINKIKNEDEYSLFYLGNYIFHLFY